MNQAFEKSLAIGPKFKPQIEGLQSKYFAENYNAALKSYYTPPGKSRILKKGKNSTDRQPRSFFIHINPIHRELNLSPRCRFPFWKAVILQPLKNTY